MADPRNSGAGRQRQDRTAPSLIIGLLLVPVSAVLAFALVPRSTMAEEPVEEAEAVVVAAETTTSTTAPPQETIVMTEPPTASRADLEAACGADGQALVDRELAGEISPLEQAALDALRQICDAEGLVLAGPPAPPPVVRTKRLVVPPSTDDTAPPPEETTTTNANNEGGGQAASSSQDKFAAAYASAQAAIDKAVAEGGKQEKIDEAREKLAKAQQKADQGDWDEALSNAWEAREKAEDALEDREDDD